MEDQKECDMKGNNILPMYFHKVLPSLLKLQNKEYLMMNHERIRINHELDQWKGEEREIKKKLMRFSDLDKQIEWKMLEIKNLQCWNQDQVDLHSPVDFVPRTTGYLRLTGMDAQTLVTPDRKRCQKRLIKKGRLDVEYLQQLQTEHLFLKKPSGKTSSDSQQLNDMIRLDDIENIKRRQIGRKTRVRRLKAELEHVRKNISCLNKKLEIVNSKRLEAYKRSYELGEENKEMVL
ncbi:hypothetical protein R6Q57_016093 [Mikania cordata]